MLLLLFVKELFPPVVCFFSPAFLPSFKGLHFSPRDLYYFRSYSVEHVMRGLLLKRREGPSSVPPVNSLLLFLLLIAGGRRMLPSTRRPLASLESSRASVSSLVV